MNKIVFEIILIIQLYSNNNVFQLLSYPKPSLLKRFKKLCHHYNTIFEKNLHFLFFLLIGF